MSIILKPKKCLYPFAKVYGAITSARNWLYDQSVIKSFTPSLPTICVGNVVVGGSCKSPFCDYLAQKLISQGRKPVILSRGYGGSVIGPYLLDDQSSISSVGDEAIMHFQYLSGKGHVVVGGDRTKAIRLIQDNSIGDVVVMDDGLQHRKVKPHFSVLMLDVSYPERIMAVENNLLLPAGYLRETKEQALKKADVVVFVKKTGDWVKGEMESLCLRLKVNVDSYRVQYLPSCFRDLYSGQEFPIEHFRSKALALVSALADSVSFKSTLVNLGLDIKHEFSFNDHYHYAEHDWQKFKVTKLPLVTSLKDGVKLRQYIHTLGEAFELVSSITFVTPQEEESFWKKVEQTNRA